MYLPFFSPNFANVDCKRGRYFTAVPHGQVYWLELEGVAGGLLGVGILEGEDECVRPVMMDGRGLQGS